jgi:hypothetical protein
MATGTAFEGKKIVIFCNYIRHFLKNVYLCDSQRCRNINIFECQLSAFSHYIANLTVSFNKNGQMELALKVKN